MNNQPPTDVRQQLIEKYMEVAALYYFEASDKEEARKDYAPAFADEVLQIIQPLIQSQAAAAERKGRKDELLEIGLLAHKFEGQDYHCREIADAIDERLALLTQEGKP